MMRGDGRRRHLSILGLVLCLLCFYFICGLVIIGLKYIVNAIILIKVNK
jgi:hypothetical protein